MTQKRRPGHCFLLSVCCHSRSRKCQNGWVWVDVIMVGTWMGRTDGVWVDVVMVGTWMLWQNGWGLGGRYHGWEFDALAERMGSGWTLSWFGHGCSGRTDGVWVDAIRYHGWDMGALAKRMGSGRVDVINMDALWQYVNTSIHTYIHTYIQTYRHTDIQTYIHTYIHTYIQTQSCEEVGPGRAEGQRRN